MWNLCCFFTTSLYILLAAFLLLKFWPGCNICIFNISLSQTVVPVHSENGPHHHCAKEVLWVAQHAGPILVCIYRHNRSTEDATSAAYPPFSEPPGQTGHWGLHFLWRMKIADLLFSWPSTKWQERTSWPPVSLFPTTAGQFRPTNWSLQVIGLHEPVIQGRTLCYTTICDTNNSYH